MSMCIIALQGEYSCSLFSLFCSGSISKVLLCRVDTIMLWTSVFSPQTFKVFCLAVGLCCDILFIGWVQVFIKLYDTSDIMKAFLFMDRFVSSISYGIYNNC